MPAARGRYGRLNVASAGLVLDLGFNLLSPLRGRLSLL
jgi:hypothetical protein